MQAAPSRLVWLEQGFSASALWTFWLILCHVWLFYGLQDIQQQPWPLSLLGVTRLVTTHGEGKTRKSRSEPLPSWEWTCFK